ncbi:hypothetical protein NHQ30_005073 [Ciborinia camelliae]|nr:hypothetical protein NHQ30_005073 [Ciborinia camelliae]
MSLTTKQQRRRAFLQHMSKWEKNWPKQEHYEKHLRQREWEMHNLAREVKELYAQQQDPEYQARVKEVRRCEQAQEFIMKNDLVEFMTDEQKQERSRKLAHMQAREEQIVEGRTELLETIALADEDKKLEKSINLTYLAIGGLLVSPIIFAFLP